MSPRRTTYVPARRRTRGEVGLAIAFGVVGAGYLIVGAAIVAQAVAR